MGEAEEFIARRRREQEQKNASGNAAANEFLISEIDRLVPLAIKNLQKYDWPALSTYPYIGIQGRTEMPWNGERRLAWVLRRPEGDGHYENQVYLLADGTMLVNIGNSNSYTEFRRPYFSDARLNGGVVSYLKGIAGEGSPEALKKLQKPWWRFW